MLEVLLIVGSWFGGSFLTFAGQKFFSRLQKMKCYYVEDDILSKIPMRGANGDVTNNQHKKRFCIKNTTNMDIKKFKVVFQFDMSSTIIDCYSSSKEGVNYQRVKRNTRLMNQADAVVKDFNRGDTIDFYFTVANVTENEYYVRESEATGFKIVCTDKREKTKRLKSNASNTALITNRTSDSGTAS